MTLSLHTSTTATGQILSDYEDGPALYRIDYDPLMTQRWQVHLEPTITNYHGSVSGRCFYSLDGAQFWCLSHRIEALAAERVDQPTAPSSSPAEA